MKLLNNFDLSNTVIVSFRYETSHEMGKSYYVEKKGPYNLAVMSVLLTIVAFNRQEWQV